ncbi:MAG: delta-60 repeat domain-containing protein [Pyrinomonadaceae bacterium]
MKKLLTLSSFLVLVSLSLVFARTGSLSSFVQSGEPASGEALTAAGDLDTSFGGIGYRDLRLPGGRAAANQSAIQPDGKIVVAGVAYNGINNDIAVARYNADGTLDTSFGNSGMAYVSMSASRFSFDNSKCLVIQPDGKIVVAGESQISGAYDLTVVRLNPNGSLDTTFGTGGKVITNTLVYDRVSNIAIQSDGKLIVGGYSCQSSTLCGGFVEAAWTLVRYNSNGSLDSTFGTGGKVSTDLANGFPDQLWSLAVQPDGKIVAAGIVDIINQSPGGIRGAVVRYNSNGTLDTSFNSTGIFIDPAVVFTDLALQSDNKIVVSGYDRNLSDSLVARFSTNGSLDPTFDGDGKAIASFSGTDFDWLTSIVVKPDGRIAAAGYIAASTNTLTEASFLSDGSPDTAFGTGGRVVTSIIGTPSDTQVLSDASLIVTAKLTAEPSNFTTFKFNDAGAPVASFGTNGKVSTATGQVGVSPSSVLTQPDGKILVGGPSTDDGLNGSVSVCRFLIDGSLDVSFAGTGCGKLDGYMSFESGDRIAGRW